MIQQIKNTSVRHTEEHGSDIGFLKNFYKEHGHFPIGKSSVSCPLKPSDSAPLKHSTMPP